MYLYSFFSLLLLLVIVLPSELQLLFDGADYIFRMYICVEHPLAVVCPRARVLASIVLFSNIRQKTKVVITARQGQLGKARVGG